MTALILIAIDDLFLAKMLTFVLSDNGYQTSMLPDPATVLPFLDEHPVNLVLLDVMLPHTDGFSLCAAIQRAHPDLPVIFLWVRGALADRMAGFTRGRTTTSPSRSSRWSYSHASGRCCIAMDRERVGDRSRGRSTPSDREVPSPPGRRVASCDGHRRSRSGTAGRWGTFPAAREK